MTETLSIVETLQAIIRNCYRNEEYLHTLTSQTRHQRKRAERLLHKKRHKPVSIPQSVEFFIPFDPPSKKPTAKVRCNTPEREQRTDRRCQQFTPEEPIPWAIMKQTTKRKYEQLPEVKERIQRDLMAEIQRRNSLRTTIFRLRLREQLSINHSQLLTYK